MNIVDFTCPDMRAGYGGVCAAVPNHMSCTTCNRRSSNLVASASASASALRYQVTRLGVVPLSLTLVGITRVMGLRLQVA